MGFLLGKHWNIVAITFERSDLFRVNGNRGHGKDATRMRDNARHHARTIYWAVFDQKGRLLESDGGPGRSMVPTAIYERIARETAENESVQAVLEMLQSGKHEKAARQLVLDQTPAGGKPSDSQVAARPASSQAVNEQIYTLLVDAGDGTEFESRLKLSHRSGTLGGMLVSPDGQQARIEKASIQGDRLTFEVRFDPADRPLRFRGQVERDIVKGAFA